MTPYDGNDRRKNNSDFESEVLRFMARIDEKMENQSARCANHSARIEADSERIGSLESTREYTKGALKTIAIGVPAIGSVAWFIFEVGKVLKELKP